MVRTPGESQRRRVATPVETAAALRRETPLTREKLPEK